jgi:ABC-type nitrate/sulfonate/bicarbonate transport system permease component
MTRVRRLSGLLFLGSVLIAWQILALIRPQSLVLLPPPARILAALARLITEPMLYRDLAVTLVRFFAGYVIGCAAGIIMGLAMALNQKAFDILELSVELLRPVPATALIPVAILFLGLDSAMVTAVVAWAVMFPVLVNTLDGARGIDPVLIDTARVFGFRGQELARHVVLPASLPQIATGMRVSLSIGIVLVIVVEMLVGNSGLGHRVIDAERTFRFPEMYAAIALIGALGYTLNAAFLRIRRRTIGWHDQRE